MARVVKSLSHELIQYVKKVHITANYWDPRARSAFEFARQMASPQLAKKNPNFEFIFDRTQTDEAPKFVATFSDGGSLSLSPADLRVNELRFELFERASEAEENSERTGGSKASPDTKKTDSKAGAKPGGKK